MGCIKRDTDAHDKKRVLSLYKSMMRQHIEYCAQFSAQVYVEDIAGTEEGGQGEGNE